LDYGIGIGIGIGIGSVGRQVDVTFSSSDVPVWSVPAAEEAEEARLLLHACFSTCPCVNGTYRPVSNQ
jgi:hypothetical protein